MTNPQVSPLEMTEGTIAFMVVDLPNMKLRGQDGQIWDVPAGRYEVRIGGGKEPFLSKLILADGTAVLLDVKVLNGGRIQIP